MPASPDGPHVWERHPGGACAPLGRYRRREPEKTLLHQVVREELETFLARAREHSAHGRGLPAFVERELCAYLDCGILARGFARLRCPDCGFERLVAFSCKAHVCPSRATRRMEDSADHFVRNVLSAGAGAPEGPLAAAAGSLPGRPPSRPRLAPARRLHPRRLRLAAAALLGLGEGACAGDGALPWPAPPEALRASLLPVCLRPLVSAGGARVQLASFRGEPAQEPLYFTLAARRLHVALEWQRREAAAVVVDPTRAPPRPEAVSALIAGTAARERSLELMFLVARGLETALAGLADRFIVRAS
ncbi:MAG TPA: transposase zinc-binding domain-containing protein [Anaeromyxobacteraceae bacterium]|nr:transposase zinc-binding domain-containing protein [Anaeromyxobacteraceae bacterium]